MRKVFTPNCLVISEPLALMERLPSGSVDLVYLDPPWNTDAYSFEREYEIFISKLFQQSYRILNDTGKIIIRSIVNQNGFFHSEAEALFGRSNLLEEFIIPRNKFFGPYHDTLIVYSKSGRTYFNKKVRKVPKKELHERFPEKDTKGRFRKMHLFSTTGLSKLSYEWRGIAPLKGQSWKYPLEKLDSLFADGLIGIKNGFAFEKHYLSDEDYLELITSVWSDLETSLDDKKHHFTIPLKGFERILEYGTSSENVILIPMCYAGRMLTACENLGRKWIAGSPPSQQSDLLVEQLLKKEGACQILNSENLNEFPIAWNSYRYQQHQKEKYIADLIKQGEGEYIEFKEALCWNTYTNQKDDKMIEPVLKILAAFMNSPVGGKILVGIQDNGTIVGIEKDIQVADVKKANKDGYLLFLNNIITGKLGNSVFSKYRAEIFNLDGKDICLIEVNPTAEPVFFVGDFYIRNGNQSKKLTAEETYSHLIKKGASA